MYCRLKTNKFPSLFLSLHALRTFSEFIEFSRKVISTHIISQTHIHTQRKRNATAIILLFLTLGCMHAMISV